jgi:C-terminal processing protease CtpA/Prc
MSGAFLIAEGRDFKTVRVDRVFERTPAAEAGLRENDLIQAVDNRPVTEYTLEDLREMFRNAGSEYLLTIQRNGLTLAIKVKMRRLV